MSSLASIKQKIIFNIPVVTKSPLRIASGMDNGLTDILVLKNKNGQAIIPGTSVAGVLRSNIVSIYGEAVATKIFGNIAENGNQSMINISDIVLENSRLVHRDGVAIEPFTGIGINGAKFDYEAIDRGAKGNLFMEITVRQQDMEAVPAATLEVHKSMPNLYQDVAATLADLLSGGIYLGSLTTKGYGLLVGEVDPAYILFDFSKSGTAASWLGYLDGKKEFQPTYIGNAETISNSKKEDFVLEAEFALRSFLLVRDYEEAKERNAEQEKERKENKKEALEDASENLTAVQLESSDEYVIPGTSIKGVIRNRCIKILTKLLHGDDNKAKQYIENLMGFAKDNKALKSKLFVDEIYISKNVATTMKHSRIRVDRFTGGVQDKALFTEEVIRQQNKDTAMVKMRVRIDKCCDDEAGLLLLVLKDFWLGRLSLGGGKAVGRGVLQGKACTINYMGRCFKFNEQGLVKAEADRKRLEGYVHELVVKCND